jgi:hypothetical protein
LSTSGNTENYRHENDANKGRWRWWGFRLNSGSEMILGVKQHYAFNIFIVIV